MLVGQMGLKENIERVRIAAGYQNAAAFARHIGVSPGTLGDWEAGRYENLQLSNLLRIAKGAKCSVEDLLRGVDPEYDSTGVTRADLAHEADSENLTYPDTVSGVQRALHNRQLRGSSADVASPSPRVLELTSALLHASAGFETLATKCREYRAAIDAVAGAQVAINSGVKPKPAKSHRGHGRSRAGVQRSGK